MKEIYFPPHEKRIQKRDPKVTLHEHGMVRFNASATRMLDLKTGDHVMFNQDGQDFFVSKERDRGYTIRTTKDGTGVFGSMRLVEFLAAHLDLALGKNKKLSVKLDITLSRTEKGKDYYKIY